MEYQNIEDAVFLERPNRFLARVLTGGKEELCHVKNTGRCKELLIPGARIYVERNQNQERKTKLDLIGVFKGERLINMDSQVPNKIAGEWIAEGNLCSGVSLIRPETKYQNSRFDFYAETGSQKLFMEVKGVTLEKDGVALFPDAPTERGLKHIMELCHCMEEGYEAYILFVIQMKGISVFKPNHKTHKAFADALIMAERRGVHILARDCIVKRDSISIHAPVRISLLDD